MEARLEVVAADTHAHTHAHTCPLESRQSLSKSSNTSELGWWMTVTTVRPFSASERMVAMTKNAEAASRPEVGSSRKSSVGCVMSSEAMETRRFCPPEIPLRNQFPMSVSAQSARPRSVMTSSVRRF